MRRLSTPRELRQRAELYEQWSTLLAAGVPMLRALATLRRNAFSRRYRRMLDRVGERLEDGETLADALAPEHRLIQPFDQALIATGNQSGRLEVCLKDLARHYRTRAKWLSQAFHASAYPLLVVMVSLLVFPVDLIVTIFTESDWMPFLLHKARIAGTLAAGFLALVVLRACTPVVPWIQALAERIAWYIPVLGSALRERALARLTLALEALLNTGMGSVDAWPAAAGGSGSLVLRNEVRRWTQQLDDGFPISESLVTSRVFPHVFTDAYRVGETSGKMQETLEHLRRHYEESASRKMELLATWVPRMIYFAVLIYVALSILRFWQGYWAQFESLL